MVLCKHPNMASDASVRGTVLVLTKFHDLFKSQNLLRENRGRRSGEVHWLGPIFYKKIDHSLKPVA